MKKIEQPKKIPKRAVQLIVLLFATVVLTLLLLSAATYSTQWRSQVDAERYRSLEVIAQALTQYEADHNGVLPELPETVQVISNSSGCMLYCAALAQELPCYNLQNDLVPGYMRELPQDPLLWSEIDSGFYIQKTPDGFLVGSCNAFYGGKKEIASH